MRLFPKIPFFVILAFLIVLRFLSLEIDPPYFFKGYTQAHLTDPYHLTFFARNAVLFDDWNPFDFARWNIFKYSLVSGTSYLIFSLFGISRITAGLTALILNLAGILFFVLAILNRRDKREIAIFLLVILSSGIFLFYSRLPFLENGLIFFSGLLFFIFIKYGDTKWGQAASGFIIVLAALAGKLFGLLLFAPIAAGLIFIYGRKSFSPILRAVAGSVAGGGLYLLIFYSGDISLLWIYYTEQTVGMYGADIGLGAPMVLLGKFLTYGSTNGLLGLSPFFLFIVLAGMLAAILTAVKMNKADLPVLFCLVWIIAGAAGLMLFNYRPLRYMLFLFPPMSYLAAYAGNLIFEKDGLRPVLSRKALILPLVFILLWYLLNQIVCLFYPREEIVGAAVSAMPLTGGGALIVTVLLSIFLKNKGCIIHRYVIMAVIIPLLAGYVVRQGIMIYQGYAIPGNYLRQYSVELGRIIDSDAVLTGPYTPALTLNNNLKGVIYHFGLSDVEKDLFKKFPITHVVTDVSNWERAKRDFPFLGSSIMTAKFIIRNFTVYVYRLPDADCSMTDYEKGVYAREKREADSALIYFDRFVRNNPDNILGFEALSDAYKNAGRPIDQMKVLKIMAGRFPENFRVHLHCSNSYLWAYKESGREELKAAAAYHSTILRRLNPALVENHGR